MNRTEKTASLAARVAAVLLLLLLLAALPLTALCAAPQDGEDGEESTVSEEGADANFAEIVGNFLDSHSGEIFSALSLAGTVLLAWIARRGLLPSMRAGLDGLAAGVDRLGECSREAGEKQGRLLGDFLDAAEPILKELSGMRDLFAALSERTAELEKRMEAARSENEKLAVLSRASVDMLKEVFTAAKLPVASKEELEAIYRRALDAAANDEGATP